MFSNRQLTLADYWLIVWRHKWLLIIPFVVVSAGTALWCFSLPNIYRASTTILVEAQKVPESYVRSTVSAPVQERLHTLTQQTKSHTRIEQVIRELGLIDDIKDRKTVESYIARMRNNIEIEVKGDDAFIVSYNDKDPYTAMHVTNRLASLFITENLKVREQHVVGTTEFLAQELERIRTLLEAQEKRVSEYTQRYAEELPAQREVNQRLLIQLQRQLQTDSEAIEQVRSKKSSFMQQINTLAHDSVLPNALDYVFNSEVSDDTASATANTGNPLEQQLTQRRASLSELQLRFSDQYPDVKRLKQEIAELEKLLAAQPPAKPAETTAVQHQSSPEGFLSNLRGGLQAEMRGLQRDVNEQLRQIELQEQRLQREQAHTQQQIAEYERKLTNTAIREQELMVLSRDYESTKQNYASLLAGHMQAKVAENLEKRQKAEQFKVLDPALLPTNPWKPDRRKILFVGLVLGLGVGCGAVLLVEYLDRSFHDPEDLKQSIDLPVLAIVPLLPSSREQSVPQRKQRLLSATFVGRWRV